MRKESRSSKAGKQPTSVRDSIRRSLKHPLPPVDLKLFRDPLLREIVKKGDAAWRRFTNAKKAILANRALDEDQAQERWGAAFDRWLLDLQAMRPLENRQRRREMAMLRRNYARPTN